MKFRLESYLIIADCNVQLNKLEIIIQFDLCIYLIFMRIPIQICVVIEQSLINKLFQYQASNRLT